MKCLVTICLAVLLVTSTVFADVEIEQGDKSKIIMPNGNIVGGDQTNTNVKVGNIGGGNSEVSFGDISLQTGSNNASAQGGSAVAHGGNGGSANANVGDVTNSNNNSPSADVDVSFKSEEKLQGSAPQLPWQLWQAPYPDEKFFWNKLEVDERELAGEWSKERASSLVDSAGIWFVRGFLIFQGPMKVQSSFDGKYPESDNLTLVLKRPENAKFIGGVSVSGKDIKALICLGRAMEEAMTKGATIVRLEHGMNTANKGNAAGIGGTHVDSDGDATSTGLLSFGSAESQKEGKPAVILACYR